MSSKVEASTRAATFATGVLAFVCGAVISGPVRAQSSNIVLIVADDLGPQELSLYGIGSDAPPTPSIDALAQNGVTFEAVWASPVCSPARSAIQTGRYGTRTGVGFLLAGDYSLPLTETTLPEVLAAASVPYVSGAFGKWHLGMTDGTGGTIDVGGLDAPNLHGYQHFAGIQGNISDVAGDDYFNWTKVVNGVESTVQSSYATTVIVDDALSWVSTQTSPWFLYVSFQNPHTPLHAPPASLHTQNLTGLTPANDPRPFYKAMVEAMDTEIGRLLANLPSGDATVIFVADNGTTAEATDGTYPGDHMKGTLFEGGVAVPMIVEGPQVVSPGRIVTSPAGVVDILATVAEIASVDLTALSPPGYTVDSVSFLDHLTNPSASPHRTTVFTERFTPNGPGLDGGPSAGLPLAPPVPQPICQENLHGAGFGDARLAACGGNLAEGTTYDITLTTPYPNAPVVLIASDEQLATPKYGGTLFPTPKLLANFVTSASGDLTLSDLPSAGGFFGYDSVFIQCLVADPSITPNGKGISNAVGLRFLPRNSKAIRNDSYKLIRSVNGGADQFYDLAADPTELVDLIANGPLTPVQQLEFDALSVELDALVASFP